MIKNGDKVTYKECFGDEVLVFVGMAQALNYCNDCVLHADGLAFPARFAGLEKLGGQS